MKVILIKDIENLGKKYEVRKVPDGYARNFLIPQNLVKVANKENLAMVKSLKEQEAERAEDELKNIQVLASKIDGREVEIVVKIGKDGKLFGSVSQAKIAEKLKEMGFSVKKTQVELQKPIKELGEWPAKISFGHGLEAEITVTVSAEAEPVEPEVGLEE